MELVNACRSRALWARRWRAWRRQQSKRGLKFARARIRTYPPGIPANTEDSEGDYWIARGHGSLASWRARLADLRDLTWTARRRSQPRWHAVCPFSVSVLYRTPC